MIWSRKNFYCWFSLDLAKLQTTKLSILQRFYFHDVLEQLKTNFHTNFLLKRVLGFVIEGVWTSKILRDTAFTWRQCLWASSSKIHAFVAKLGNRCFCWFPSAMLLLIRMGTTTMVFPYKSLYIWVKRFFEYLVYELFLWPEIWWGSLHIYLLSFRRFWTLSVRNGFEFYVDLY